MKKISKVSLQFFFALALVAAPLVALQLKGTEAFAQSSYFTSKGCVDCHSENSGDSIFGEFLENSGDSIFNLQSTKKYKATSTHRN